MKTWVDFLDESGPPYRDETSNRAQWFFVHMTAGATGYRQAAVERFGYVPRSFEANAAIAYILRYGVHRDA